AILFALTTAAVMSAFNRGADVQARNEVSQLGNALQAFKTQFQVQYPPDRLIFPPGYDSSGATQQYLKSIWPRLDPRTLGVGTTAFTLNGVPYAQGVFTYWQVPGTQPQTLQGDQVLVWVLGGWRDLSTNATFGFSTDATDPMKPYT